MAKVFKQMHNENTVDKAYNFDTLGFARLEQHNDAQTIGYNYALTTALFDEQGPFTARLRC